MQLVAVRNLEKTRRFINHFRLINPGCSERFNNSILVGLVQKYYFVIYIYIYIYIYMCVCVCVCVYV